MSKLLSDECTDVQANRDHIEIDAMASSEATAYETIRQRDVWLRKAWGPTPIRNLQPDAAATLQRQERTTANAIPT